MKTVESTRKKAIKFVAEILEVAASSPSIRRRGPRSPWSLEVSVVGASAMRRLNRTYRGKDYATDVLSFPAPEVFFSSGLLGELVLCLDVLKRQARECGHAPEEELKVLLTHGVLHLLGMDHEKGGVQARRMALAENRLLRSQGLIARAHSGSRSDYYVDTKRRHRGTP